MSPMCLTNSAPWALQSYTASPNWIGLPTDPTPTQKSTENMSPALRQFRIQSASQAKALVKLGNLHRRVFGTLANRESSRSHGMVIIKIIRGHRGERDDPTALQVSRLTLVDLAGSERTKHTHTTGERLKEAGNINKSLMVLGQCMEVMRSNQRKLAMSLAHEGTGKAGRMDTRDVKRTLAVVPFRHSKLTEALMDYFVGESRVTMIVNINPYDTGYDENSHVMKFASLAKEITTMPAAAPVVKPPPQIFGPGKTKGHKFQEPAPAKLKGPEVAPNPAFRRKVTISMGGGEKGRVVSQTVLDIVEEDEMKEDDNGDEEEDDEYSNPLIDALFDEIENLRFLLFESEMRAAVIEAETREEVMREMEDRMRMMEQKYSKRLMSEMERNEMKTDAKIDMLHQAGLFSSPMKVRTAQQYSSEEEEEDVEMSLVEYEQEESDSDEEMDLLNGRRSRSASPLARKEKSSPAKQLFKSPATPKVIVEKREFMLDGPGLLPSDDEDAELTEMEQSGDEAEDDDDDDDEEDEDEDALEDDEEPMEEEDEDDDYKEDEESEEEDDWEPPVPTSAKKTPAKSAKSATASKQTPSRSAAKTPRLSKLAHEMDDMKIKSASPSLASVSKPTKKLRKSALDDSDEDEDEEPPLPAPKKKRQLAKKAIVTVDNVEQVPSAVTLLPHTISLFPSLSLSPIPVPSMPKVDKKAAAAEEGASANDKGSSTTMITASARSATTRAASGSYKQKTLTSMFSKVSTSTGKGKGKAVAEAETVTEKVTKVEKAEPVASTSTSQMEIPMKVMLDTLEKDTMHPSWYNALKGEFEKPYFVTLKKFLATEMASNTIFPSFLKAY
ncbi:hypothetical protein NMY22_g6682 [Coprinellus aureogranulatus]|nr:hypothetical protein NMY22_g6682 [Coprinellus aureogranulatus]